MILITDKLDKKIHQAAMKSLEALLKIRSK